MYVSILSFFFFYTVGHINWLQVQFPNESPWEGISSVAWRWI